MQSILYPNIQNTEIIRKFSGHVLAACIANDMTADKFASLCKMYGMKFIYGSPADLGLASPECNDDRNFFWTYMSDLFNPKAMAQLNPIF